jgi:hypothetical protein
MLDVIFGDPTGALKPTAEKSDLPLPDRLTLLEQRQSLSDFRATCHALSQRAWQFGLVATFILLSDIKAGQRPLFFALDCTPIAVLGVIGVNQLRRCLAFSKHLQAIQKNEVAGYPLPLAFLERTKRRRLCQILGKTLVSLAIGSSIAVPLANRAAIMMKDPEFAKQVQELMEGKIPSKMPTIPSFSIEK